MRRHVTVEDDRFDYGEVRYLTYGYLDDRLVNVVWTARPGGRRIISMRHCHAKEAEAFKGALD
ncbi:Ribonuclease toxin, BrnT, of type II toxin-antitoxin system [Enhydrobacter aerosaccus]|uniref:Ribonuclease toxin, BrnT, of type II toxin-antitoxin system n=2 Tax=Enhydrobacter aerosaccus TaxID=225324 RepID=A0A1T4TJ25_9HYPH|nr:Ribonuclease toxin, BrnT, of type II toxin-antitoxin system [Enhydrobacter aerosaccus]